MVRSVEKAMRILTAFENGQSSLGLTEVAAITGLDKSGAQRFTHTLVQLGYLRKDPESRRFELTPRVLELGAHYTRSNPLIRAAAPYLLNISKITEEAVSLTMLDGSDIVYVYRLVSRNMLTTDVIVGTHLPAYCTAPGLAILSGLPRTEAQRILEQSNRIAYTPHTTTELPVLIAKLEESTHQGFALVQDQIYLNDVSIAVPIFGPRQRAVAAINIAVNKLTYSAAEAVEKFVPLLVSVAKTLSHSNPMPLASR
ncbi:IclR family transcriptional regulator [Chelatococcus asaccharovorans]|uniref:IclR family transcriptional regulator n=2 Tax=Chelatococcus asaccharovorans TaxID=28210 RepID=A0A2V3UF73_9HYPH|nr:IclR family transcriptional regulator C-terminal domain-containing protein [Chelatococcus asaccharovorans]MBS7707346.1 helix-turn-helix domain-containing protein [Chelatococcus asaccharovorans]PXW63528.1 IclR family transcriptional regulator [Chelatococcus asaccharovorans]CAH1650798.1 IclR family transcriptional regulator [Chelatococcus asaccharovorans]CAH1692545.1 IclR family transcriptional regulator [Chelatococcus asaccharovorans]